MHRVTCLFTLLLLASAAPALAQDEEGGEPGDDDGGGGDDDATPGAPGGDGGEDPNVTRKDDEDTSKWSYEGQKDEVKAETKTLDPKKDLPPEPPATGVAGAWYEAAADCSSCESVLGQTLDVSEPTVMRQFYDQLVINPDLKAGKIVYINEGQNRPVAVLEAKDGRVVAVEYTIKTGDRKTDIYATLWDWRSLLDNKLLYGRKYNVTTTKPEGWASWEKGYQANKAFVPEKELQTYANLSPVKALTTDKSTFDLGDKARVVYLGANSWVRSDFSTEAYKALQGKLQSEKEAERQRASDQKKYFNAGIDARKAKDWAGARTAFEKARSLGLDTPDLHFELGSVYQVQQAYDLAAAEYQSYLNRSPDDTAALYNMGRVLEKQNKLKEALAMYQKVIKVDPTDEKAKDKALEIALKLQGVAN